MNGENSAGCLREAIKFTNLGGTDKNMTGMNHVRSGQFAEQSGNFYEKVAFVALNPPMDLSEPLDHAILGKIEKYFLQFGGKEYRIINIFSAVHRSKKLTRARALPIASNLDGQLRQVAKWADVVIACWGKKGAWHNRAEQVLGILQRVGTPVMTVDTDDGHPAHIVRWRTSRLKMEPYPNSQKQD